MKTIYNQRKRDENVNEGIKFKELLVIDENGEKLGILSRNEAIEIAYERDLDIVVVSPQAKPPVAKIMDYSKYRYEKQKREKENRKNQHVVDTGEIQLSPNIEQHDFDTKLKKAMNILSKGNKVKISIRFRGRMIVHQELGKEVIDRFILGLSECSTVDSPARMDGRTMIALVSPKKEKDNK